MYLAVCDDKTEELEAVLSLLDIWQAEHGVTLRCKTFQSAVELVEAARRERFTLYLLDVMMPGMDGLECAREIRCFDDVAEIVFLSTSPGFAYESYGVRALNYLLKPVEREKLFALLNQLFLREQKPLEALTLKTGTTIIRVPYTHISYVEVIGKHLYFHLTDGDVREVVGSLRDYEALLLPRPEFMRVHRSYLVNMLQVEELSSAGLRTFQGNSLPVSRLSYPQLQKDYMTLLFERKGAAGL
ncbi:MAG: LytTR family DNA-binding domain-containing protein [Oscillospiraceae bacterium]|nr:LytTR family DNA-binding domain-containing protein [Oscillospiraceae bacterium]